MNVPGVNQLPAIVRLLAESGLSTDDLADQDLALFLVDGGEKVVEAVGGLERCGETALVRSVATVTRLRGQGKARSIIDGLEQLAVSLKIDELYLLTETAESFFESLDYVKVDRSNVPVSIRRSRQFSSLCPESATVMSKRMSF